MTSVLDRIVSAFRRWVEDRLPWYDRAAEQARERQVEALRQRSIRARVRSEAVLAQHRLERR